MVTVVDKDFAFVVDALFNIAPLRLAEFREARACQANVKDVALHIEDRQVSII